MHIKVKVVIVFTFLFSAKLLSQDTLNLMAYNFLNYKTTDNNKFRYNDMRKIINYVKPDAVVACEIEDVSAAQLMLDSGFNKAGNGTYLKAAFVNANNGTNTINMLFYKASKITLKSQTSIATSLRDIVQYRVYKILAPGDTAWLYIHMAHLKAGSSTSTNPTDENQRLSEITSFCSAISSIPQSQNVIFCGDLNFKGSIETGWSKLTTNCSHNFIDPINQVGYWNSSVLYKNIHTQSTRSNTSPGCCGGSTGGLDDRFDFILGNSNVINGYNKVKILAPTYKTVGNDGQHLNLALTDAPSNSVVPVAIAQALYNMSDHLPVVAKFLLSSTLISVKENNAINTAKLFISQEAAGNFLIAKVEAAGDYELQIIDVVGKNLISKKITLQTGYNNITPEQNLLTEGIYHAILIKDNFKTSCLYPSK
jgi:endonuclease/exonuclease/phosphatase family metal-dependent hydrolase